MKAWRLERAYHICRTGRNVYGWTIELKLSL